MKGIWTWPADQSEQEKVLSRLLKEDELSKILFALASHPEGLSNAQLDKLLANNSQWRTLSHLREVIALGFVEYDVDFFGGPGKYQLTGLGRTVIPRLRKT